MRCMRAVVCTVVCTLCTRCTAHGVLRADAVRAVVCTVRVPVYRRVPSCVTCVVLTRLNTYVPLLLPHLLPHLLPLLRPQVSKIMLAAGTDLAPFWRIYRQHLNSELPRQLLAGMQVGSLNNLFTHSYITN